MKHINTKIATLLHEGFSISTLEGLNEGQINLLYEKAKKVKKEPKEIINVKKGSPEEKDLMSKGKLFNTYETEVTEKAKSKKQQQFFGIVRGMQKGDIPKKGKAGKVAKDIDPEDAKDFAKTKHKGLPKRKTKKKSDSKEDVKKLEEGIMRLIESHLPPHTTKGELLYAIRRNKR